MLRRSFDMGRVHLSRAKLNVCRLRESNEKPEKDKHRSGSGSGSDAIEMVPPIPKFIQREISGFAARFCFLRRNDRGSAGWLRRLGACDDDRGDTTSSLSGKQ